MKARKQAGEIERPDGPRRPDRQPPRTHARERGDVLRRNVDLAPEPPGVLDEALAGLGHPHATGRAVCQRDPELGLELGDLLRERGLRDVDPLRGTREAALLSERDEVSQLAKVDS